MSASRLIKRVDTTGLTVRKSGSDQQQLSCTADTVTAVKGLVLGQDDSLTADNWCNQNGVNKINAPWSEKPTTASLEMLCIKQVF